METSDIIRSKTRYTRCAVTHCCISLTSRRNYSLTHVNRVVKFAQVSCSTIQLFSRLTTTVSTVISLLRVTFSATGLGGVVFVKRCYSPPTRRYNSIRIKTFDYRLRIRHLVSTRSRSLAYQDYKTHPRISLLDGIESS